MGWHQDLTSLVDPVEIEGRGNNESTGDDLRTAGREWMTLKEHREAVLSEV
ncbi:MAG: hypothetical protein GWN31_13005, partial [Candidatus Thorarchaeota archaeon]|nr:hypothetical protein [Candidatus Thorarchaeota archaeon]